ncbi:MAG: cation transporter [Phycisphaerales bacterium]|nr:cation transporter [Phycisphaerales bacterium]
MRFSQATIALVAVVVSLVVLAMKLAAWWATQSDAVLSDALESIVNVVASAMTLGAVRLAAKPPDAEHPYGHGRVEFVSAAVEGGMLVAAGAFIIIQSVGALLNDAAPITQTGWGLALVVAAGLLNLALARLMISVGRRTDSAALIADGVHVLSDSITTAAVIVGLVVIWFTGWTWVDPIIALALGCLLLFMGWRVAKGSVNRLIDRQDDGDITKLNALLTSHLDGGAQSPTICSFHKVRCRHDGPMHWIDMHIRLPRAMSVAESHDIASVIEGRAIAALGGAGDATVHCEPCSSQHCSCGRARSLSTS